MLFIRSVMKKAVYYSLMTIGALIFLWGALSLLWIIGGMALSDEIRYMSDFSEAKIYIAQLERYRQRNGHYPDDEKNQDIVPPSDASQFTYNTDGGSGYILYVAIDFDETYCFFSSTRKWSRACPPSK